MQSLHFSFDNSALIMYIKNTYMFVIWADNMYSIDFQNIKPLTGSRTDEQEFTKGVHIDVICRILMKNSGYFFSNKYKSSNDIPSVKTPYGLSVASFYIKTLHYSVIYIVIAFFSLRCFRIFQNSISRKGMMRDERNCLSGVRKKNLTLVCLSRNCLKLKISI